MSNNKFGQSGTVIDIPEGWLTALNKPVNRQGGTGSAEMEQRTDTFTAETVVRDKHQRESTSPGALLTEGFTREQALLEAARCTECGKCVEVCPINANAPEVIRAIKNDDTTEAVRLIYTHNPFAHACSRICVGICENACAEELDGNPITVRLLERYAIDTVNHEQVKEIVAANRARFGTGRRVAIVGSGLTGLSAAYDLVQKGHVVVIYEATDIPGGMMRYEVPNHSLPDDRLDDDIDTILSLGIDLRLNMAVGKDITMDKLHSNFDAVLIASGQPLDEDYLGSELTNLLEWDNDRPRVDESGQTTEPWLWAAGYIVGGQDIASAIASGRRAAVSMHNALMF